MNQDDSIPQYCVFYNRPRSGKQAGPSCTKGDACPFLHEDLPCCKFYLAGKCTNVDCKFEHPDEVETNKFELSDSSQFIYNRSLLVDRVKPRENSRRNDYETNGGMNGNSGTRSRSRGPPIQQRALSRGREVNKTQSSYPPMMPNRSNNESTTPRRNGNLNGSATLPVQQDRKLADVSLKMPASAAEAIMQFVASMQVRVQCNQIDRNTAIAATRNALDEISNVVESCKMLTNGWIQPVQMVQVPVQTNGNVRRHHQTQTQVPQQPKQQARPPVQQARLRQVVQQGQDPVQQMQAQAQLIQQMQAQQIQAQEQRQAHLDQLDNADAVEHDVSEDEDTADERQD